MRNVRQRGFTLIEVLISTVIIAIIVGFGSNIITNFRNQQLLDTITHSVATTLEEARQRTLASDGAKQYGVHLESDSYTLFEGDTYVSTDPNNIERSIDSRAALSTITLTGGGSDVVFERLTGRTNQSGTFIVDVDSGVLQNTVTINGTGIIDL